MKESKRADIIWKTDGIPHLEPIFHDVNDIVGRVNEYDDSFFLVFNKEIGKFEIHSLLYPKGQTKELTIPYDRLDARTLRHLWKNDIRVHGKEIFKRMEKQEEQYQARKEREQKNWLNDIAREMQFYFAKDAWV